jgi:hypothetical protein
MTDEVTAASSDEDEGEEEEERRSGGDQAAASADTASARQTPTPAAPPTSAVDAPLESERASVRARALPPAWKRPPPRLRLLETVERRRRDLP